MKHDSDQAATPRPIAHGSADYDRYSPLAVDIDPDHAATFRVSGIVEHGDHRGRTLGFPTANLYPEDESLLLRDGVYGGFARQGGQSGRLLGAAAISVGTNPTFGEHPRRLEAHIIDFDEDVYGQLLEVEILFRVRGILMFANVDELVKTMHEDIARCRERTAAVVPFADAS